MEHPNKGHVGANINSAVLSFVERLSSFRGFTIIIILKLYGKLFWELDLCPL